MRRNIAHLLAAANLHADDLKDLQLGGRTPSKTMTPHHFHSLHPTLVTAQWPHHHTGQAPREERPAWGSSVSVMIPNLVGFLRKAMKRLELLSTMDGTPRWPKQIDLTGQSIPPPHEIHFGRRT